MRLWLVAKILLHPLRTAQERIDKWVMARVKRQAGPITVTRQRVYILPTRFGYTFALMTFVMLMGAMNYSNSMAFALAFLLGALGLVCMHQTHANMVNLQMRPGRVEPVFAGEIAHFEVQMENTAAKPRYSLALTWPQYTVANTEGFDEDGRPNKGRRKRGWDAQEVVGDLAPREQASMKLALPAARRGWLPARVFSVGTDFPLGLFHAWTWAELEMTCVVYPRPADSSRPPPPTAGGGGLISSSRSGQDEFAGLRNYQRGDSFKSIHWKSLPKLRMPMVKQFAETLEQELWLDWESMPDLDTEQRLSQLTRWILDAEAGHNAYGLRIPGLTIKPGRGAPHQHQCLSALALYG